MQVVRVVVRITSAHFAEHFSMDFSGERCMLASALRDRVVLNYPITDTQMEVLLTRNQQCSNILRRALLLCDLAVPIQVGDGTWVNCSTTHHIITVQLISSFSFLTVHHFLHNLSDEPFMTLTFCIVECCIRSENCASGVFQFDPTG